MNDKTRFAIIIVLIIGAYALFFFQDSVKSVLKNPFAAVNNSTVSEEVIEELTNDNVRVVVVNEEDATIKVVEESAPAVVSVVRKEVYFDPFRGPFKSEDSIGTGFIIDGKQGIVLTNKHVVDSSEATYSVVIGEGEKSYDVEKVYRDPINDFAILKIDITNSEGEELPSLPLGDSDNLRVGQTVIAIGNALGEFGNSTTKGIVSGLGRGILAQSGPFGPVESLDDVIQTDAALNPGNSGGPLINLQGNVIGINVAVSQGAENIGFSIPINTLEPVIEDFLAKGKISRPYLGVEYAQITKEMADDRGFPVGAFIRRVVADSPADKAKLEAGDIILKINGIRLDEEKNTLARVIATQEPGEEIELLVDRDGKEMLVNVILEDLEE